MSCLLGVVRLNAGYHRERSWWSWPTIIYGWLHLSPVIRHNESTTDTVSNVKNIFMSTLCYKPTYLKVFDDMLTLYLDLGVSHGPLIA